jgi:hypothetical protein
LQGELLREFSGAAALNAYPRVPDVVRADGPGKILQELADFLDELSDLP